MGLQHLSEMPYLLLVVEVADLHETSFRGFRSLHTLPRNLLAKMVASLVGALGHPCDIVAAQAVWPLVGLANESDAMWDYIVGAGALAPLVTLLGHSCGGAVAWAAGAL